jgi:hypothetical protein
MSETYVTEEEIGEALDLIEPEQSEATDPVPGTFLRNKEHPEDQRSSFLPPTVRNEEHLFLDVAALLYAGQHNNLFGDPESGKTLLCQAAQAEALKAGRRVLTLDLDHNGPETTISRLLMLGAPWDVSLFGNRKASPPGG